MFYEGTQPSQYCDLHQFSSEAADRGMQSLSRQGAMFGDVGFDSTLNLDLPDLEQLLNTQPSAPSPAAPTTPAEPTSPAQPTPLVPPADYTAPPVLE